MKNYRILNDGFTIELNPSAGWEEISRNDTKWGVETSYQDNDGNIIVLDEDNELCGYVPHNQRAHKNMES